MIIGHRQRIMFNYAHVELYQNYINRFYLALTYLHKMYSFEQHTKALFYFIYMDKTNMFSIFYVFISV